MFKNKNQQKGQSSVEFFIITSALIIALITPIPNNEMGGFLQQYQGSSVIEVLIETVKKNYAAYSYAKSVTPLPTNI